MESICFEGNGSLGAGLKSELGDAVRSEGLCGRSYGFGRLRMQVRRSERYEKRKDARLAIRAPRPTHQPPILVHAVFSQRKNALVNRLREILLSKRSDVSNNIKHTYILYESRACVPPRRGKVDRWRKRIVRDGHWDACERWGHHGCHFVVLYQAQPGRVWPGKKETRTQRVRDSGQISACRSPCL